MVLARRRLGVHVERRRLRLAGLCGIQGRIAIRFNNVEHIMSEKA
jgi:hypothetical protein